MTTLIPDKMIPLATGSIRPEGWLKHHLDLMTEGLLGRLYETSEFLIPGNGWLVKDSKVVIGNGSLTGWEEQPYWFRSFVKLAIVTQNERCLKVSREWIEGILSTMDDDGWYGPAELKAFTCEDGAILTDVWGHMVMNEALLTWYDYTGDKRCLECIRRFLAYLDTIPEDRLLRNAEGHKTEPLSFWHFRVQCSRAGDILPCVYRVYELTGDEKLLSIGDKVFARLTPPNALFLDAHTVNFAQRFPYWTTYYRRSGNPADLVSADYWYDLHMAEWGNMPRGAFAADENTRIGCTDPRYGTESCTWAEFTRSFQLVGAITADPKWADRCEDIVFNHAPVSYTPDWKELHYITACNQVNLDAGTSHNYANGAMQVPYSSKAYRCCRHNAGLTYPLFCESLVQKADDGALVFWMYAPCSGTADLGGAKVSWKLDTIYPFRETASLRVSSSAKARLRFRVPGWATSFTVSGKAASVGAKYLDIEVDAGDTTLEIAMGAETKFTPYPRCGGISIDRGPLTYSLAIGERTNRVVKAAGATGSTIWVETPSYEENSYLEYHPTTPWNYGLDLTAKPEYSELPWNEDCFQSANPASQIIAKGRAIPEWMLQDNQPAELQGGVAFSDKPLESLRFVPLCCQRLRLSVLPPVTDDPAKGRRWKPVPASTPNNKRPPVERGFVDKSAMTQIQ